MVAIFAISDNGYHPRRSVNSIIKLEIDSSLWVFCVLEFFIL